MITEILKPSLKEIRVINNTTGIFSNMLQLVCSIMAQCHPNEYPKKYTCETYRTLVTIQIKPKYIIFTLNPLEG